MCVTRTNRLPASASDPGRHTGFGDDRKHQRYQVRIDEEVPSPLPEAHLDVLDLRAGSVEYEALRDGLNPVDLLQQRRKGWSDHLDEPDRLGLACSVVGRLSDHLPGRRNVAVVLARELPDVGCRVVDDLSSQILRDVFAAQ